MRMFKLNKIRGHIKMLEFQQLKLTRYLAETQAKTPIDDNRVKDINRALKRVTDNIAMWNNKISAFPALPKSQDATARTTRVIHLHHGGTAISAQSAGTRHCAGRGPQTPFRP